MEIRADMTIEDLVREHPKAVRFLAEKGIKCIACGEPIWGTLRQAAEDKGFSAADVDRLVQELTEFLES